MEIEKLVNIISRIRHRGEIVTGKVISIVLPNKKVDELTDTLGIEIFGEHVNVSQGRTRYIFKTDKGTHFVKPLSGLEFYDKGRWKIFTAQKGDYCNEV